MTVAIKDRKGMRYGSFNLHGIHSRFPIQVITSTNLGHAKDFDDPDFDFGTKVVEIVEFFPMKLVNNPDYRKRRIKKVSKMIEDNPKKLFLLTVKGARSSSLKFTKQVNESLIDFQIECEFKLIKVFFQYVRNAVKDSRYYRSIIPKRKTFVAALDENLSHATFRALYLECYRKHKDKIITFMGRKPSKGKNKKTIHNKLNFLFISKRRRDRILRLVSFAPKSIDSVVSSLIYYFFGFDAYSFITRRGGQDIPEYELLALHEFTYLPLTKNSNLICPITGMSLYTSSQDFEKRLDKSSLPVSVHDIVRLNELFETIHENYTRDDLAKFLGNRIFQ